MPLIRPPAVSDLQHNEAIPVETELHQLQYLNNIVEQDHRGIKRLAKAGLGFFSFYTARCTLAGFEIMNMIRKGQMRGVKRGDVVAQGEFLAQNLGIAA